MVWPHYKDPSRTATRSTWLKRDFVGRHGRVPEAEGRHSVGLLRSKYLTNFHRKQDHDYIPVAFLQGGAAKQGTKPIGKKKGRASTRSIR
jgi:hypothetical protein